MIFYRRPQVGRRAFKVWQRNKDAWLKFYKASMVGNLAEPILFLVAFGLGLGKFIRNVEGVPYIQFIAPGLVIAAAMNAASFECTFGSFTRMSTQKSYDAIIVTPVNIDEVAAGDILWGATKGFISAVVMLPVLIAFGLMSSPWLILSPVLYVLHEPDVRVDGAYRYRVRRRLTIITRIISASSYRRCSSSPAYSSRSRPCRRGS